MKGLAALHFVINPVAKESSMTLHLEKDIAKIKEFVRHSAEFIAYFELADSKMREWQSSLEKQLQENQQQYEEKYQHVHAQLEAFEEMLTQAGLARFRLQADEVFTQSTQQLQQTEQVSEEFLTKIKSQQQEIEHFLDKALGKLDTHSQATIQKIDQQLARYDADHFRRVANESCDKVENAAQQAVHKSFQLLNKTNVKITAIAIVASVITAFTIGLYVSDEWPWEMHQQAMNEREAGKMLMHAWPKLSQNDRNKIITNDRHGL
jgi:hypothetical protein